MKLAIIVGMAYQSTKRALHKSGIIADINIVKEFCEKYFDVILVISDINDFNIVSYDCLRSMMENNPGEEYEHILFYFSGHGKNNIIEQGNGENMMLPDVKNLLYAMLEEEGKITFVIDCCGLKDLFLPLVRKRGEWVSKDNSNYYYTNRIAPENNLLGIFSSKKENCGNDVSGSIFTQKIFKELLDGERNIDVLIKKSAYVSNEHRQKTVVNATMDFLRKSVYLEF